VPVLLSEKEIPKCPFLLKFNSDYAH